MTEDNRVASTSSIAFSRRTILRGGLAGAVASALSARLAAYTWDISDGRPAPADRRFSSPAIESVIARVKRQIFDSVLATMVERCFPNTLDTTVFTGVLVGSPDTQDVQIVPVAWAGVEARRAPRWKHT